MTKRFAVALSFAGTHLKYIEQVANNLAKTFTKERVFYYPWFEHECNGIGNLAVQLPDFYLNHSDVTAPFICTDYVNSPACMREWASVLELIYQRRTGPLMLFRFDQAPIEGLHSYDCYSVIGARSPEEIAALIVRRWNLVTDASIEDNPDQPEPNAFKLLKEIIGERVLSRLGNETLKVLREQGGFLAGQSRPDEIADVTILVDDLHKATDHAIPIWKKRYPERRDTIKLDCRLLLGELLKLAVCRDSTEQQLQALAVADTGRLSLSCRYIGTAMTLYCALRDLPLLFMGSKNTPDGLDDVLSDSVVDLTGLATGVGSDVRNDVYNALHQSVRRKPATNTSWEPKHINLLKAFIDQHRRRDFRWHTLTTETTKSTSLTDAASDIAQELSVGLVLRDPSNDCNLLNVTEESLVALVCDYVDLLEKL